MKPVFPVIVLKPGDRMVYYFENINRLERTSRELLVSGIFNNCSIIDQRGDEYKIDKANEIGYANPLWGYSFVKKGIQILVCFDLIYKCRYNLDELKERLSNHATHIDKSFTTDNRSALWVSQSIAEVIQTFK